MFRTLRNINALLVFWAGLVLFSCQKSQDRSCLKFVGDKIEKTIPLDATFDSLELYDNLVYNLIPDTVNKVVLVGGENLLNHVLIQNNSEGKYKFTNENKCNFLRSYQKKIETNIHFKTLRSLYFEGSERLNMLDTLKSSEFRVQIRDGAGSVNLLVNNGYTAVVVSHGFGDFSIAGKSVITFLNCSSNSFCDATELQTSSQLIVKSNTQGDMKVNADNIDFEGKISRSGDILYRGTPNNIEIEKKGDGNLINID